MLIQLVKADGITPAYAGNTKNVRSVAFHIGDHPRLRGEHLNKWGCSEMKMGSPPPTRGTHDSDNDNDNENGITPAYAGNTECQCGTMR